MNKIETQHIPTGEELSDRISKIAPNIGGLATLGLELAQSTSQRIGDLSRRFLLGLDPPSIEDMTKVGPGSLIY